MEKRAYFLHALSPLHAGTGQAADVIDLPIARMKGSNLPIVPGSSIKGVLRDCFDDGRVLDHDHHRAVFGPGTGGNEKASDPAGALMLLDARLLALPVRSFRGTFSWVTSPWLLRLAHRDIGDATLPLIATLDKPQAIAPSAKGLAHSLCVHPVAKETKAYLEDLDLPVTQDAALSAQGGNWALWLGDRLYPSDPSTFARRLLLVDDETMTFFFETGTQVDTRVRLDADTRTVARGALWAEESLPPESVLFGLAVADRSRRDKTTMNPRQVLDAVLNEERTLQFGGKATVGRGLCRLIPVVSHKEQE